MGWWFVAAGWAAEPAGGGKVPMCAAEVVAAEVSAPLPAEDPSVSNEFIVRFRRQVNVRWRANIDALRPSLRLDQQRYTTVVAITLREDGGLIALCMETASGAPALDLAVTRAIQQAAPFGAPPPELLRDGAVHLRDLDFTVMLGRRPR